MSKMKNRTDRKKPGQKVVKSMASLAKGIAKDSLDNHCFLFVYQPEKPKDMAERLAAMNTK